jgi:tetratricopeptide (TPR) repeat protein
VTRRPLLGGLALAALVLAVYLPVTGFDFVSYDDVLYVTDNPAVLPGLTRAGAVWAFQVHGPSMWVPLTWLSHMATVSLAGVGHPGAHHAVNLALHAAGVLMLYAFLLAEGQALLAAGLAAALWAVHPLHVESVAWVTERKDVLAGACWMLTLLAYRRYALRPGAGRYAAVLGALALALMAKPVAVTLPLVLLLLDAWPLGRLRGPGGAWQRADRPAISPARAVAEKLPMLALAAYASWMTVRCQESFGAVGSLERFPLSLRAGNAVVSYASYLRTLLWPADLAVLHPYPARVPAPALALALLVLLAATALVLRGARRRPAPLVGWLWFLGVLVPMSGLVQTGLPVAMADRFAYLPAVGLYVGAAVALDGWASASRRRAGAALLCAAALLALAATARRQVMVWRDSETLFRHALAADREDAGLGELFRRPVAPDAPGRWLLHLHLGKALVEAGRVAEGIAELRQAAALDPADALAHYHLGGAYRRLGRPELAAAEYRAALGRDAASFPSLTELAQLELDAGRTAEALALLERAVALAPGHPWVRDRLGAALLQAGRGDAGVAELRAAAALAPWDAEIRGHLEQAEAWLGSGTPPPRLR